MTNALTISREMAERLTRYYPAEITDQETMQAMRVEALAALDDLRALLAAPAVERQPIAEVQHGPFNDVGVPQWVRVVTLGDFDLEHIPDGTKLYTSPPASVAVDYEIELIQFLNKNLETYEGGACVVEFTRGFRLCIDKVKEMNG